MDKLPPEVVARILERARWTGTGDLSTLVSASRVNHQWNALAQAPLFVNIPAIRYVSWEKLAAALEKDQSQQRGLLVRSIDFAPLQTDVHFGNFISADQKSEFEEVALRIVLCCPQLRSLSITYPFSYVGYPVPAGHGDPPSVELVSLTLTRLFATESLSPRVQKLSTGPIQSLRLHHIEIEYDILQELLAAPRLVQLTLGDIACVYGTDDMDFLPGQYEDLVAPALSRLERLVTTELTDMTRWSKFLPRCTSLEQVTLPMCLVGPPMDFTLFSRLPPTIKQLHLSLYHLYGIREYGDPGDLVPAESDARQRLQSLIDDLVARITPAGFPALEGIYLELHLKQALPAGHVASIFGPLRDTLHHRGLELFVDSVADWN